MDGDDLIELANKLRSLGWSGRMDDLGMLLAVFGWQDPNPLFRDWLRFDAGLGSGICDVIGRGGDAERIEVAGDYAVPRRCGREERDR